MLLKYTVILVATLCKVVMVAKETVEWEWEITTPYSFSIRSKRTLGSGGFTGISDHHRVLKVTVSPSPRVQNRHRPGEREELGKYSSTLA